MPMASPGRPLRVLLVDDHALFREGIRLLLESAGQVRVVGEASNGREAIERTEELRPDLVLMDIAMPGLNGLEATREIRRRFLETRVLVLTMYASDEYFFRAMEAGASGYVLKEGASGDLMYAIKAVSDGAFFIYPSLSRRLVEDYLQRVGAGQDLEGFQRLTRREREVLQLIAEGHTNQEIADRLGLGLSTVQTHRGHIMEKLDLHSRAHLMQYAVRAGLHRRPQ